MTDGTWNTFEPRLLTNNLRCPHNINNIIKKQFPLVYPDGRCFLCGEAPGTAHHILCQCPVLTQARGDTLTVFRRELCKLVKGKMWPLTRLAEQWVFPSLESDFRYGKVPIGLKAWTRDRGHVTFEV